MSANKTFFDNKFLDYSFENSANYIDQTNIGISRGFVKKIQDYKTNKLDYLWAALEADVFCDVSVYTGSAGLALYYYLCYLNKGSSQEEYLYKAVHCLNLDKLSGRRITFLCGDAGPLALASVISYKLIKSHPNSQTNLPNYKELVQRLVSLVSLVNDSPDELLYGRAGYLYALLFVNKHTGKDLIATAHIEKVIDAILKSGRDFASRVNSKSPMMWQWHDKMYFGGAHGVAGILYTLLQARQYKKDIGEIVKPTLDWMLDQACESGNFPSSHNSSSGDRLVQWCHGAPGFTPLCLLAYEIYGEERYMSVAINCGNVIWERGLCTKGYSICHGVAGNAYSFIQLFQATKNLKYLYQACCFLEWCMNERPGTENHSPDRPASLFEGVAGRIYLAEDLMLIENAKFPAYTI